MSISSWEAYWERLNDQLSEAPTFQSYKSRRARAQYDCHYCHRAIPKGHRYISYFFVTDGVGYTEKQCDDCYHGDRDERI